MSRSFIWLVLCNACVINSGATEFADITTDPAELAFDSTPAGQSETKSVAIMNRSSFSVRLRGGPENQNSPWSVALGADGVVVAGGGSAQVEITFTPPATPGNTGYGDTCVFTQYEPSTNTSLGGAFGVRLSGIGTAPIPSSVPGTSSGVVSMTGALADWSEVGFACTAPRLIDAGAECETPLDCPTSCCPCGADGGDYRAGACILGQCLPELECGAARLGGSPFCEAPAAPDSVNGALGFAIAGTWSRTSPGGTLTIVLSGATADGCNGDGGIGEPALVLSTLAQPLSAGAWPLSGDGGSASLEIAGGSLTAETGALLLTQVSDAGISGDFAIDLVGDGGTTTLSGAFTARLCANP